MTQKRLEEAVEEITCGIQIDDFTLYVKRVTEGRFKEEKSLEIYIKNDTGEERLLHLQVYFGFKPHYRPWIEFFGINNHLELGIKIRYFDSKIEEKLLEFFSTYLGPGETIYVEYSADKETYYALIHSFPPASTRLGYKLFELGFTWFKDWYFAEGGSEGGQKLGGEKPLDEKARKRHLRDIRDEIISFIEGTEIEEGEDLREYEDYLFKAVDRAKRVLGQIDESFKGGD